MSPRRDDPIYVDGYARGLINAPASENPWEGYGWASDDWLAGHADGYEDWVPGTPGSFVDP